MTRSGDQQSNLCLNFIHHLGPRAPSSLLWRLRPWSSGRSIGLPTHNTRRFVQNMLIKTEMLKNPSEWRIDWFVAAIGQSVDKGHQRGAAPYKFTNAYIVHRKGEPWKRYRSIMKPLFTMVWPNTNIIYPSNPSINYYSIRFMLHYMVSHSGWGPINYHHHHDASLRAAPHSVS